ncbi:MAG TPA: hypothetical protein VN875_09145 [Candidatus Binatus sp.]|nr:hypothetical protein [Candidatus Binatus sp.]
MNTSISKAIVQDCTTLRFAVSLLRQDHHALLAKHERYVKWALLAYENHGHEMWQDSKGCAYYAEPYGSIVLHIVDYDAMHGHTPNLDQLCGYMERIKLDHGIFGHNIEENQTNIEVLHQFVEDNAKPEKEREYQYPADAEVLLTEFVEKGRIIRVDALCKKASRLSHGNEEVYDRKMKENRRSTLNDAINTIHCLLQFDLTTTTGTGSLKVPEIPQEAIYGWLGQKAVESGIPLGFIYPALFGVYAGSPIKVKDKRVHPCVDVALCGDVETGKSQAIEQAEQMLGMKDMNEGGPVCHRSASSDRGLFNLFGDDPKQKDAPKKAGNTFVMCLTELRHMMSKMAMQNNSLTSALCALWDKGADVGTADKYKNVGCAVNLSIVGGLKCATMDEFGEVFGADTMHGLFSRFIIATTSEKWEYTPYEGIGEPRTPADIEIPAEAWERLKAWRREKRGRGRAAEIALRIAVITEAAEQGRDWLNNLAAEVNILDTLDVDSEKPLIQEVQIWKPLEVVLSMEALEAALRFMEWQEAVKTVYTPSEGIDDDARCTEAILKALEEHGSFKWNTMCKNRHWAKKWGARRVQSIRNALDGTGQISYDKDTGWVDKV